MRGLWLVVLLAAAACTTGSPDPAPKSLEPTVSPKKPKISPVATAKVRTFKLTNPPKIGTTRDGDVLSLGGFSGLIFVGKDRRTGHLRFLTHTDRGPNTEPAQVASIKGEGRGFALPDFQPRLVLLNLDIDSGRLTVAEEIKLRRADGRKLTGLPNKPGFDKLADEVGVDLRGRPLAADPYGADLEGIASALGSYWLGDEYRPSIFRFDRSGRMQQRFVPIGSNRGKQIYGKEVLPAVLSWRKGNRGFEGVAADGDLIYAIAQSPLEPDGKHKGPGHNCRLLAINGRTGRLVGHYVYTMESNGKSDKIGDLAAIGGGRFLVMERDDDASAGAQKNVFVIDVKGATNLVKVDPKQSDEDSGIDALTFDGLIKRGIIPVAKRLVVDLSAAGLTGFDKLEGLAIVDARTLAIVNDNDFGLGGDFNQKTGRLVPNPQPQPSTLTLLTVDEGW
jgi:hypothetical protein